jgi:DNA-binding transcriptional MerR regulator
VNYEPGDAAHRLGVSASGLRRLAAAFEEVHGDLPRKVGTKARLYPETALAQIAQARALVDAGRYKGNAEALDALKRGLEPDAPSELTASADQATPRALALFAQEQHDMREDIRAMRRELAELRGLPPAAAATEQEHGPLVRAALWLERLLKRL